MRNEELAQNRNSFSNFLNVIITFTKVTIVIGIEGGAFPVGG